MAIRMATVVFLTAICVPAPAAETSGLASVLYARDIQPLLAKHCMLCHGPDEAEAGLRLDIADDAYGELDSGERAIVPGRADASELMRRVTTTDDSLRMPPDAEALPTEAVQQLRRWIDEGADYEGHWAYERVTQPALPEVHNDQWVRNPIDQFVLAGLENRGITPSPPADRPTLIRRLYYDLIGLPPTPDEVDAFTRSSATDAYQQLVERLLASEHFGERWGRHWLDKARYADSDGYEKDNPRLNAWCYRDWVIKAINEDMPFDEFTIEQLAGDLLPDASPSQRLATAFHRQTLTNTEGGIDKEQFRVEATFDRTETTSAIWMALTMTCARCHSHKFDQISQHDYYQLFAFFNNANEANTEVPRSEEALAQYRIDKRLHDEQLAVLETEYTAAKKQLQPQIDRWLEQVAGELAAAGENSLQFHPAQILEATADSQATLTRQDDKSWLVSGLAADKDRYTLVLQAPAAPLTGFRLELLTHESLGRNGPGRTPHGNFVLSEIRAETSNNRSFSKVARVELVAAEADFAQQGFAPEEALSTKERTGWAIAPRMGKNHWVMFYTKTPLQLGKSQFLRIVLDQQYGGQHTIGRFRVSTMAGLDALHAMPKQVADAVRTTAELRTDKQRQWIANHVASLNPETAELGRRLEELKKDAPPSPMMSVRIMAPAKRKTTVLHRGDFLQPAEEVSPAALTVICRTHPLHPRSLEQPADRLDLARWLVDPQHPLTSRVTVNDVWAHLFGRGIVPTVNDFGVRGARPTHPGLLDWLAWRFPRDMHWSRKALIKTIVMSATYRQSSRFRSALQTIDPTNRLFARQNRIRVEAEVVRDLYLAVSNLLSQKIGGPSVYPPLPPGVTELSYANNFKWKTSEGEDRYRRGMYTFFKRTSPPPTLISFDCPDSNTSRLARETSNTPLQALATLNNAVFLEAAQAMAQSVLEAGGDDDPQRLTYALRLCMARQPTDEEADQFRELLVAARHYYASHPEDAKQLTRQHAAQEVAATENAAWIATVRMILNLDEFIVRD